MKALIRNSLVFVLLGACALPVSSQTKREVQFSLDTLYKSHEILSRDYKKLLASWYSYDGFFEHIKKTAFDKSDINVSIEEAQPLFDTAWNGNFARLKFLEDSTTFLLDSLLHLKEMYFDLKRTNETYLRLLTSELNEASFPHTPKELLRSWQLYLSPMQLSGDVSNSGIVSHNPFVVDDSLHQYNIYQIDFLVDELANIHFKNGHKQKCFYEVHDFHDDKPFSISCSKQDEFNLTLHISPMPNGLEVSYEIPIDTTQVIYFNGVMKP